MTNTGDPITDAMIDAGWSEIDGQSGDGQTVLLYKKELPALYRAMQSAQPNREVAAMEALTMAFNYDGGEANPFDEPLIRNKTIAALSPKEPGQ